MGINFVKYLALLPLSLLCVILWFRILWLAIVVILFSFSFSSIVCAIVCWHESRLKKQNQKHPKKQQNNKNPWVLKRISKTQGLWSLVDCGVWKNTVHHVLCEDVKHICVLDPLRPKRFSKVDWDWEMLELDDQDFQCHSSVPKFKFF